MTRDAECNRQKRAVLYPRVSTGVQESEGTSLATQEEAMRRHAAQRGYAVEHVLTEVHTGTELWERPQLSKLRELVRARAVDVVVAYAIDRLSRDPVHLGVILSEAEHAGVEVEFVTEPLDDSPEGQLIRFVRGYAAKVEHEKIKERTMRGKQARLKSGKLLPGSKPLYGYRFNADRTAYEVEPADAAIVRRIKDEILAGSSLRSVCARLMADGVPPPGLSKSTTWYVGTLRQMLVHPGYTGRAFAMRKAYTRQQGKILTRWRPTEEQIPLPEGVIPPLFTVADQEAIAARLRANKQYATRNNQDPESALLRGGYVRCGVCGTSMYVRGQSGTAPPQYACANRNGIGAPCGRHSVSVAKVDAAVWAEVRKVLTRPEIIARELDRLYGEDDSEADVQAVERALTGVDRQMRTLVEQLSNVPVGSAVADLVMEKLAALEEHKGRLEVERADVAVRRANWQAVKARLSNLTRWCRRFAERLDGMSYADRRDAVFMLGVLVRVWPKGHPDKPDDVDRFEIRASVPLSDEEVNCVSLLDTKNRLLGRPRRTYRGSLNSTNVRVGDLFREAVRENAASIVVLHNHPSGDPTPSPEDVRVTRDVREAGKLLDVELLDHIVVTRRGFVSLKQRGLGFQ